MKHNISNLTISTDKCYTLAGKLLKIIHHAIDEDTEGNHEEGILSEVGKTSCQIIHEIDKAIHLALSPEVKSAVNYVETCIPVDMEDCDRFIIRLLGEEIIKEMLEHLNLK